MFSQNSCPVELQILLHSANNELIVFTPNNRDFVRLPAQQSLLMALCPKCSMQQLHKVVNGHHSWTHLIHIITIFVVVTCITFTRDTSSVV